MEDFSGLVFGLETMEAHEPHVSDGFITDLGAKLPDVLEPGRFPESLGVKSGIENDLSSFLKLFYSEVTGLLGMLCRGLTVDPKSARS